MSLINDYNKLYDSFDELTKESADKNRFTYIYTKAYLLLKQGPEIYRKNDFFQMPLKSWDSEITEGLINGCNQIIEGKGLLETNPCKDLGISVFYRLFEVFHFKPISQKAKRVKLGSKSQFLDIIEFEHYKDRSNITYHNLV